MLGFRRIRICWKWLKNMELIKEYAFCGLVLALAYGLEDMFWEHGLHGTKINIAFVVAVIICIIIIGCSFLI